MLSDALNNAGNQEVSQDPSRRDYSAGRRTPSEDALLQIASHLAR